MEKDHEKVKPTETMGWAGAEVGDGHFCISFHQSLLLGSISLPLYLCYFFSCFLFFPFYLLSTLAFKHLRANCHGGYRNSDPNTPSFTQSHE